MRDRSIPRKLTSLVAILIIGGSCGFVLVEGWPFLDALYMTIITISTVGYGEVQELTANGRVFAAFLITVSIVSMTCWNAGLTSVLVSGEITGRFRKEKEKKMINQMKGHTIVCGGGVTALTVIQRLRAEDAEVVVVTDDPKSVDAVRRTTPGVPVVEEDPKSEFAMAQANALMAKNLVAAVENDYDNLLITITGRELGTGLNVISFASSTDIASRMLKVGADEVVCPQILSGEHVASQITNSLAETATE